MSLLEKQWLFSQLVARFIWELRDRGYHVSLGEAMRSPDAALLNSKQGDGIKNSLHIDALAIDLKIFVAFNWLKTVEDIEPAGKLWESYSTHEYQCCWGGRFKDALGRPKPDAFHFSIAHGGRK